VVSQKLVDIVAKELIVIKTFKTRTMILGIEFWIFLIGISAINMQLAFMLWIAIFKGEDKWWTKLIWIPPLGIISALLITLYAIPYIIISTILDRIIDKPKSK